jgi:hypothetical protein
MSVTGAQLECVMLPDVGALVQLIRGALIVHALVVWSAEGRCGLKFSGRADVAAWRTVPVNTEQQRVDEVIRLVKAGAVPLPVPPLGEFAQNHERHDAGLQVTDDLRRACALLDELATVLAGDRELVERHGSALQNLDIAMQVIAAVSAISAGETGLNADASKVLALRRSADQALLRGL